MPENESKIKKFWEKHRVVITIVGTGVVIAAGVILGKKILKNIGLPEYKNVTINIPFSRELMDKLAAEKEILKSYGAVWKEGLDVPFATKEIATKFLEERGNTYQIDIMDDLTSVIWISKE